jgi:hypothetical protein
MHRQANKEIGVVFVEIEYGGIRLKSRAVEGLRESPELGMNVNSLLH